LRGAELAGKLEGRESSRKVRAERGALGARSAAGGGGSPEAVSRSEAPGLYPGRLGVLGTESRLKLDEPIGEAALWKENLRMGAKRCVKGP
jgi:hypothetical protein